MEERDWERMNVVWWGRGPHPTCMNSGIREGIVQRAKSRCVPFHGVTSQSVHGRYFWMVGSPSRSTQHTYSKVRTEMFALQVKMRQFQLQHSNKILKRCLLNRFLLCSRIRCCTVFFSQLDTLKQHSSLSTASYSPLPLQI